MSGDDYVDVTRSERHMLVRRASGLALGGPPPVNSVLPAISGTPTVGQTLTSSTGTWTNSPTGYAYQWKRGGVTNIGTNSNTYTLQPGDAEGIISCTVTATNVGGSASATSASVGPVVPLGAAAFLLGETNGFATDLEYPVDAQRVAVKVAGVVTEYGANAFFSTFSGSPSLAFNQAGLLVWAPHNLFANSDAPATQSIGVVNGATYTVKVTGSGSMTSAAGVATEAAPLTFVATTTSYTWTKAGTLTAIQMNRGAVATAYLPTTAPRYGVVMDYDPVTHASRGALGEPIATNLNLRSQELNVNYDIISATVGVNATTDPMGTSTADALIPNNVSGFPSAGNTAAITVATATAYTFSLYAKNGSLGNNWISVAPGASPSARAWFNLATGVKGTRVVATDHTITALGGGWYRLTVTWTTNGTAFWSTIQANSADNNLAAIVGNGTSPAFYLWGLQLEVGTVATSYIPTFDATVTRNTSSTIYFSNSSQVAISATAGSWGMKTQQISNPGDPHNINYTSGGLPLGAVGTAAYIYDAPALISKTLSPPGPALIGVGAPPFKMACAYANNDAAVTGNGLAPLISTVDVFPKLFAPGASTYLNSGCNGWLYNAWYVPRRKSNAQIQTDTT